MESIISIKFNQIKNGFLFIIKSNLNKQLYSYLIIITFILKHFKIQRMIHTFALQCTKIVTRSAMKQIINLQSAKFYFSTEIKQEISNQQKKRNQPESKSDFSPIDYYRNTIRKVNIKSNGRGLFTPYNLQKLINMSTTEQHAKVMYEAYYNYMGHFTLIPNKVVDSLIIKSIIIGNQVDKVLEIFSHHNYLAYFPHYDATFKFINHLFENKDQQNLEHIFRILIRSPLIKINAKIVNKLLEIASDPEAEARTKEYVMKVLLFRRKLVDGINYEDLMSKISATLQQGQFGPFQAKPMIKAAIEQLLGEPIVSQEDKVSRFILASTFSMVQNCGSIIGQQEQEVGSQYNRYFEYMDKLCSRGSDEVNLGQVLKGALSEAKLSLEITKKIEIIVSRNNN